MRIQPKSLGTYFSRLISSDWFVTLTSATLIMVFMAWLSLTYIPVLMVETKYQFQQVLTGVFGVQDIRQLIIPNFEGILDLRGQSRHQAYGITIPRLQLDEPVVFNVDPNDKTAYTKALRQGIAHASGTAIPDNPGLGYYFAHSSSPDLRFQYNAVFYLLGKLKPDDEVFIWHDGQRYEYRVTHNQVVSPNDVSFLQQDYSAETIVLQTCWPPGTTSKRLLVFAERIGLK